MAEFIESPIFFNNISKSSLNFPKDDDSLKIILTIAGTSYLSMMTAAILFLIF